MGPCPTQSRFRPNCPNTASTSRRHRTVRQHESLNLKRFIVPHFPAFGTPAERRLSAHWYRGQVLPPVRRAITTALRRCAGRASSRRLLAGDKLALGRSTQQVAGCVVVSDCSSPFHAEETAKQTEIQRAA